MKRIQSVATILFSIVLFVVPASGMAQGKGHGGGNDKVKGPPPTAGTQPGMGHGRDEQRPVAVPQSDKHVERGAQPGRSGDHPVGGSGNAVGREVRGGVRGMERRSPVANAVANGPKVPSAQGMVKPEFLQARDVRRFDRDLSIAQVRPEFRNLVGSNRASDAIVGGALAYAMARGLSPEMLSVIPSADGVQLRNRAGQNLLYLDEDQARSLGAWRVAPLADKTASGSPSFCRSGAGHPVWGRQWCVDKGFGLGTDGNMRWGSVQNLSDFNFTGDQAPTSLTTNALLSLIGPVAFNRLALHALTLGLADPLTGTVRSDPSGQRLLLVSSGRRQVAEIVDLNNDKRADQMLVALRPW